MAQKKSDGFAVRILTAVVLGLLTLALMWRLRSTNTINATDIEKRKTKECATFTDCGWVGHYVPKEPPAILTVNLQCIHTALIYTPTIE